MTIRVATYEDLDQVKDLAMKFIKETRFKDYFDEDKISELLQSLILSPDAIVLIGDGAFFAGRKVPSPYGLFDIALELAWWVAPDKRKNGVGRQLLEAFEYWASRTNCRMVSVSCMDKDIGKIYKKFGYKLQEYTYLKEVK